MVENSPEELEGANEEEELNSINPLNEEDAPVEDPTDPVEPEPDPEPEPEPDPEPVITTVEETKTEPIPYETVRQENEGMLKGEEEVTQEGVDGELTIVETVTFTDGHETDRVEKSREVTIEAIDEIIDYGTKEKPNNRRNKKMKYGLKEVADVIFFDIQTDRPVLVFDTSK